MAQRTAEFGWTSCRRDCRCLTCAWVRWRLLAKWRTAASAGQLANFSLTFSPKRFGKLVYYFSHARLCVYHARTEFFEVHYAVHLDRPLVFVRDITLRHDRPLGQADGA